MISLRANLEFDPFVLENIKKSISHYGDISPSVWEPVSQFSRDLARKRAVKIVRYSVKKKTQAWRKWASENGINVKTINEKSAKVLTSPRTGRRSGSFINAFRESDPELTTEDLRTGSNGLKNGQYEYNVHLENYHNNAIEEYFVPYLISRQIIPPDGLLGLSEEEESLALSRLMEDVYTNIAQNLGFI